MITQTDPKIKLKIGLVFRDSISQWVSCTKINSSLLNAYSQVPEVEVSIFKLYSTDHTSLDVVKDIIQKKIEVLVFVDHQVRPMEVLRFDELQNYIKTNKLKVILHLYGCYADRVGEYYQIGSILQHQDLHLIAASPRHLEFVRQTLVNKQVSLHLIPFPINATKYLFNSTQRIATRQKFQLKDDDLLFVYTGRISGLKNVELAMKLLARAREMGKKLRFMYVGNFDDYEPPLPNSFKGSSSLINAKLLEHLDPDSTWCSHHNVMDQEELSSLLSAADAFISLSVFRGEDYGMSIAEAKSAGLPCFLTNWGGLSGFSGGAPDYYANVKMDENDFAINLESLLENILHFQPLSDEQRSTQGLCFTTMFGETECSKNLSKIVFTNREPFNGIEKRIVLERTLLKENTSLKIMLNLRSWYESYWK